MRDIKFRVYNPRDNKVHYDITGFEYIDNGNMSGVFIDGAFFLKEEVELMQYTGIKDKNGKEIYEGDIVKVTLGEIDIGKVIYEYNEFTIDVTNTDKPYGRVDIRSGFIEVIGNIYDNPELLKGEQS